MSNKMKCPFCNKKLEPIGTSGQFQCGTWGCDASFNFIATRDVWEYIERTRKALEIAQNAADNSREKLAAFMHDTWGNWFVYQLNNSTVENLQRWGIQSNTPYSSLTETDKDKDRKFADKIIEIIKEQIDHFADVSKMIEHKE